MISRILCSLLSRSQHDQLCSNCEQRGKPGSFGNETLLVMCRFYSHFTSPKPWPRTPESVATATAQQEPAPRRMVASAATAIALQELAQRRTEASAATATVPQEPAPRNSRYPLV
ncbi:hypothetical protein M758_1G181300 [Ceratodon purpureus]|uniref:Uncharacterized protein n=1 Tax=Ceratodon purpureus TaxID=3225 RepID=A0A8T0J7E2_CERPU|nr:hypothetical protein KC19_1G184100 [Ceratodon purpureus]KAG0630481.1 hypothetical protein M758_1G181300 [Ceratodon purpureus]KAG0630482.1 hypothetical protein M758_1G181300 [Ceratodon purpureus]